MSPNSSTDPVSAPAGAEAREAALDLDDFSELADSEASAGGYARRRSRPLWISALVVIVGCLVMSLMYRDFLYWIQPENEPLKLGQVEQLMAAGELREDWSEKQVEISGTPDVQSAARFTTKDGYVGFLRLIESGTAVFAAIPRKEASAPAQFPGKFVGRLRRLEDTRGHSLVRNFFAAEALTESFEITASDLVHSLRNGAGSSDGEVYVKGADGRARALAPVDRIQISLARRFSVVQMGRSTWSSKARAKAALAKLGRAYTELGNDHPLYFNFVLAAEASEFEQLRAQLHEGLTLPEHSPKPNVGAMLLSRRITHVVRLADLSVDKQGRLQYRPIGSDIALGYELVDGKLQARAAANGQVHLRPADVARVRVDRHLHVGAHTHVLSVGERPSDKRNEGLLFLMVFGLVAFNAVTVVRAVARG